jgi:preprotein translocase SecE subunit
VGVFFRELLRVGVYKRTQGRIARQATFAALAIGIALGLWRLSTVLQAYDPSVVAKPAMVACTTKSGNVEANAELVIIASAPATAVAAAKDEGKKEDAQQDAKKTEAKAAAGEVKFSIPIQTGEEFVKVAEAINARSSETGVRAEVPEEREGKDEKTGPSLRIATKKNGVSQFLKIDVPESALQVAGLKDGAAHGCDELNLGLQFVVPGVLLLATLWMSFRAINMPGFADFLIAVEAEMNKVSWPAWSELSRASVVVLILVFALAAVISGFDYVWALIFHMLGVN